LAPHHFCKRAISAIAADIPRRQPRYKRYHRPVAKIAAEEVKLLKHFAGFNRPHTLHHAPIRSERAG
jgi:hypothetical protein